VAVIKHVLLPLMIWMVAVFEPDEVIRQTPLTVIVAEVLALVVAFIGKLAP
jgi:hypothetical protein